MLLAFGVLLRWKLLYMLSRIVCLFLRFGIYWDEILILMAPLVLMQLVGCWLLGMLFLVVNILSWLLFSSYYGIPIILLFLEVLPLEQIV